MLRTLRLIGLAGIAVHLVAGLFRSFPLQPGQLWCFPTLLLLLVAVAVVARVGLGGSTAGSA